VTPSEPRMVRCGAGTAPSDAGSFVMLDIVAFRFG
jgi:hypothetical protein